MLTAVRRWASVGVATLVMGGALMLMSPPGAPRSLVDAVESGQASGASLRIVDLLCLGHRWPSLSGTEIKALPLAIGVAAAALLVGIGWLASGAAGERRAARPEAPPGEVGSGLEPNRFVQWLGNVALVDVAQLLLVLVVVWSVITRTWSPAPDLSIRATFVVATQAAWALLLSRGLARAGSPSARPARAVAVVMVALCFLSAVMAFRLYGLDRWPAESFLPIGRGWQLGACMIPAIVLAVVAMAGPALEVRRGSVAIGMARWVWHLLGLAALVVVLTLAGWGVVASGSRSAWLGVGAALAGVVWFSVGRRARIAVAGVALVGLVASSLWLAHFARTSGSLASADVRTCGYGWRYALRTWAWSRGTGIGQGGFEISCEPKVVEHLIDDPTALAQRWRGHAQSEWLEVLCDLGLVGLHLTLGVYLVTLIAGTRALGRMGPGPARRCLIGLMAALVGMIVEEGGASGLRFAPLPTIWYTVLAAIWAILLSCRATAPVFIPRWPARAAGAGALGLIGLLLAVAAWRNFLGEHHLALASQRARSPHASRVSEAVVMAQQAMRDCLGPRDQARAHLASAQAHYRLASLATNELLRQAGQAVATAKDELRLQTPTSTQATATQRAAATRQAEQAIRSVKALWVEPGFRAQWGQADQHLNRALRLLADLQTKVPSFFGRSFVEAEVCQQLARLWELRASLSGATAHTLAREALKTSRRYYQRQVSALTTSLDRQPFSDAVVLAYLRAERQLPLSRAVDLLRRPLRNPLLSDEYRAVILQVASSKGFPEAFAPYVQQALSDSAAAKGGAWKDPFSPETLRMAAIIRAAEWKIDQVIARLNQALPLYAAAHDRLSVQEAQALADLAWFQLVDQPSRPWVALQTLDRALVVSERPRLDGALLPIYRRMMHVLLAAGDEAAARELTPLISWSGPPDDPDLPLAWSYEVLGRTFHRLTPDRRPSNWAKWVQRAAQLDPSAPGVQLLMTTMASEEGDDARAAESLARAWELSRSPQDRHECLRTLMYALKHCPRSRPLYRLRLRIIREVQASTQPSTTRSSPFGAETPPLPGGPVPTDDRSLP